jgi:cell division protein FtsB
MAAPVIAPRKPAPRKPGTRKPPAPRKAATTTTRSERNERALARARSAERTRTAAVPRTAAPARRKSGAAASPKPRTAARPKPRTAAPATSPVARVLNSRGMPLVDRVLRGPAWVVMLGALLAGIVFLNVSVLELNRGIARTDAKSAELERTNSGLRARVAKLDNGERIQQLAAARGFVMPQPGDVTYVHARPSNARLAAQRIAPPAPPVQSATTPSVQSSTTPPVQSSTTPTPTSVTTPTTSTASTTTTP